MAYADSVSTAPAGDKGTQKYLEAVERYDRGVIEWHRQCETINKIYLDQHRSTASTRRFAMLWSNIETLKPAVYARLPVAVVSRRFKDADKIGRKAGEVLERCINTSFDLYGVDDVLQLVRDDRLLAARGQAWVRYEAEFESGYGDQDASDDGASNSRRPVVEQSSGSVPVEPAKNDAVAAPEKVSSEHVCCEFVHWADFGHDLRRTWPEVTIVWRRVYMTRAAVEKRWGKDKAGKLTYAVRPEYAQRYGPDVKDSTEPQAIIYEIWDKTSKRVCWIAKEEKTTLESGKPPLNFRGFFPCPRPAYGTHATGSLIPTPDYRYYQDQAEEINDLTEKIAALQEWLILKAFIPAGPSSEGSDAIKAMLQELSSRASSKALIVPVESWAAFSEKGGSRMIDWLPLDMVANGIKIAIECRQALINDVYQITGISDILRGETDPNETLGAQEIKAQTGSRRIQTCQRDLARFARDLAEMVGEVVAEVFQPQTLADMSGFDMTVEAPVELKMQAKMLLQQAQAVAAQVQPPMMPPQGGPPGSASTGGPPPPNPQGQQIQQQLQQIQQQLAQIEENKQVLQLLRDEKTRNFRIEIETDSTVEPDEQAEKQRRVEFLEVTSKFFQQVMPQVQVMPQLAPLAAQSFLFLVRGFRAGRELEDTIEQAMQAFEQQAQQPRPDPEQQKLEMEKQAAATELQFKQAESQQRQAESQQKLQFEQQKHEQTMQFEREKHQNEMAMKGQEMQMRQAEGEQAAQQKQEEMSFQRASKSADLDMQRQDMQLRQQEGEAGRDFERDKASLPKREDFLNAMQQQGEQVMSVLDGVLAEAKELKGAIDGIVSELSAPADVMHGPDGRVAAVRRGSRTIPVRRMGMQ